MNKNRWLFLGLVVVAAVDTAAVAVGGPVLWTVYAWPWIATMWAGLVLLPEGNRS